MKKICSYGLGLLIILAWISAGATESTNPKTHQALTYLGKPIDALCFSLEEHQNTIDLRNCGLKKQNYSITGQDNDLIKDGYIGYNWKDVSNSTPFEGDSYYKIFPAGKQFYWVFSLNNTGGSGQFTALHLVKRQNPYTLQVKTIAGGDRCNSGIVDVSQKNQTLYFHVNLVPFDFLSLGDENPHDLKSYDDLAACAACCLGRARYQLNLNSFPKFTYVDISGLKLEDLPTQGKYQACFNNLVGQYLNQNKTQLDQAALKKFAQEFNEKCVKVS